jgi:hypothetical protein
MSSGIVDTIFRVLSFEKASLNLGVIEGHP